MSGLGAGESVTIVAAVATLIVLGGMFGERRLFGLAQHLLAGLATGYLAVLAIREALLPRLLEPLAADPAGRPELWIGLLLAALTIGIAWLPRRLAAVPLAVAIGSLAAFALGGAVVGTILPQGAATIAAPTGEAGAVAGTASVAITLLVMLAFVHGPPRGRLLTAGASAGRWLVMVGAGGWLGYLLVTRLVLLVDRIGFLLVDWLGVGR
jgi:hypothetical protein